MIRQGRRDIGRNKVRKREGEKERNTVKRRLVEGSIDIVASQPTYNYHKSGGTGLFLSNTRPKNEQRDYLFSRPDTRDKHPFFSLL